MVLFFKLKFWSFRVKKKKKRFIETIEKLFVAIARGIIWEMPQNHLYLKFPWNWTLTNQPTPSVPQTLTLQILFDKCHILLMFSLIFGKKKHCVFFVFIRKPAVANDFALSSQSDHAIFQHSSIFWTNFTDLASSPPCTNQFRTIRNIIIGIYKHMSGEVFQKLSWHVYTCTETRMSMSYFSKLFSSLV